MDQLGQRQADKAEESGSGHCFHHDHHTGEEDDCGPVDTAVFCCAVSGGIPELTVDQVPDRDHVPDDLGAVHTQ